MKRRSFFKNLALGSAVVAAGGSSAVSGTLEPISERKKGKVALKIAYITDVHIRANARDRFKNCLAEISKSKVDFFLNGGDSVFAVDYKNITRETVFEFWDIWDDCKKSMDNKEVHSCLGNHDMWWAAPTKDDEMYGKEYAVKRLGIPNRYYSFEREGWHFIVLDGNKGGGNVSLDTEQFEWLKSELGKLSANTPVLIMSHYPVLGVTTQWQKDYYQDFQEIKKLFYTHRDKVKIYLSGHTHLLENIEYNGVKYLGNGAVSGSWWGTGGPTSAGPGYMQETPPGYSILTLYSNGQVESQYHPHKF